MADDDDLSADWGAALAEQRADSGDDMDDLAAEWGAALEEQGVENADAVAAQWAAMIDDNDAELDATSRGADRVLNQEEIDNLLGFNVEDHVSNDQSGIRSLVNSALVSYERLPMLEIVFDRFVRETTTTLRNFTSDNVEVSLDGISSVRFGDYLNSIPLPAILAVVKAEQWDNYGLMTVDSSLIYSIIDVLLGGGRGTSAIRVEGRPYTTIEMNLVRRMIDLLLADCEKAFAPLTQINFTLERLETQSALRADLAAGQCLYPDSVPRRHGRSGRHRRDAAALRHHRAHPQPSVADDHGREVRPRQHLGRPPRHRDL